MSVVKKTLTVVGVLIIVAIVGFLALGAVSSVEHGSLEYSVDISDTYPGDGQFGWDPSEGETYAVVEYTLTNNDYSSGVSNNILNFELIADGIRYTASIASFDVTGYDLIDIMEGSSWHGYVLFEIPKGTLAENCTLEWDSMPALDVKKV